MIADMYFKQARLMLQLLPLVMKHDHFALKGGTAINFFVRNLPRLSIDIDLAYVPVEDRKKSIQNISDSLKEEFLAVPLITSMSAMRYSPSPFNGLL
jgi:predicted nucleotidyltransferase component of viral defense system